LEPANVRHCPAPLSESEAPRRKLMRGLSACATALISAMGIATCAAAPEFIWQGLTLFLGHLTWLNLISALLIALVFVSFVEPILKRIREILRASNSREPDPGERSHLFSASLGITFGLVSVCLHEAVSAFVSGPGAADRSGLRGAIELATGWAMVPLFIAIAWQAAHSRWLAVPTGIVAVVSSGLAGWIFGWTVPAVVTTAVPSLTIQFWGYQLIGPSSRDAGFARHAGRVAVVAVLWLALASLARVLLAALHVGNLSPYTYSGLLVDFRFYLGWVLGLLLAPSSNERGESHPDAIP
jgi:hypothetical protein